jgi:hypothetical protein
VGACELDPREVRSGVEHLFELHYKVLFYHSDPYFYLVRWWLRRAATLRARGNSAHGYAKWLVMSAMWTHLGPLLSNRARRKAFASECETEEGEIWMGLCKAIDKMYTVAQMFYVATNKMRAESERLDISRFYRDIRGLHDRFAPFWRSARNRQRKHFNKQVALISRELDRIVGE